MYVTALNGLSQEDLKNGFSRILKVSPKWSIIRVDRDPTIKSLKTNYFAKKGILLQVRRSVKHMTYFENILRNVKRRFIKNMRINENDQPWTYRRLVKALEAVCYSYNYTPSSSHTFKPADVNDSKFDPLLRRKLYGPLAKPRRFEETYVEQLRLRKKMNTPNKSKKRKNPDTELHKKDLVYIEFEPTDLELRTGKKAYRTLRRKKIYEVGYVNTFDWPFIYRLRDVRTHEDLDGYYYSYELSRFHYSPEEIEEVLQRERTHDGRNLILVKFKGLDNSFNAWLPAQ